MLLRHKRLYSFPDRIVDHDTVTTIQQAPRHVTTHTA
jgi:hypothetical protein